MKKVVFLGAKPIGYACFKLLLDQAQALGVEPVGVLTKHNANFEGEHDLASLAVSEGVRVIEDLDELCSMEIDLLISVQYHLILKKRHIEAARELAVNLHMAPLPELRGCNQFSFAIQNEMTEFGTTLHCMDPGIDSGDLLFESRFPIPQGCLVDELYALTYDQTVDLFEERLPDLVQGNYTPVPQALLEAERGTHTYYRKDIGALKSLQLDEPVEDMIRRVRATSMPGFEPPFFEKDGRKYYVVPEKHWKS